MCKFTTSDAPMCKFTTSDAPMCKFTTSDAPMCKFTHADPFKSHAVPLKSQKLILVVITLHISGDSVLNVLMMRDRGGVWGACTTIQYLL